MYVYCLNNPVMYVDTSGNRAVKCDARESLSDAIEGLTAEDAAYVLGVDNTTNLGWVNAVQAKRNDNWKENKNKRKGFENRQKTGAREKNVGHPNVEEHGRTPKGNTNPGGNNGGRMGGYRINYGAATGMIVTTIALVSMVGNDFSGVGIVDNVALLPTVKIWWDYAQAIFG